jgi:hypothetical protein
LEGRLPYRKLCIPKTFWMYDLHGPKLRRRKFRYLLALRYLVPKFLKVNDLQAKIGLYFWTKRDTLMERDQIHAMSLLPKEDRGNPQNR